MLGVKRTCVLSAVLSLSLSLSFTRTQSVTQNLKALQRVTLLIITALGVRCISIDHTYVILHPCPYACQHLCGCMYVRTHTLHEMCFHLHAALDMVHSSLVSSISIDPVRLQSYNTSNPPSAPQITAIPGLEVRILPYLLMCRVVTPNCYQLTLADCLPVNLQTAYPTAYLTVCLTAPEPSPTSEHISVVLIARDAAVVIIHAWFDCPGRTTVGTTASVRSRRVRTKRICV